MFDFKYRNLILINLLLYLFVFVFILLLLSWNNFSNFYFWNISNVAKEKWLICGKYFEVELSYPPKINGIEYDYIAGIKIRGDVANFGPKIQISFWQTFERNLKDWEDILAIKKWFIAVETKNLSYPGYLRALVWIDFKQQFPNDWLKISTENYEGISKVISEGSEKLREKLMVGTIYDNKLDPRLIEENSNSNSNSNNLESVSRKKKKIEVPEDPKNMLFFFEDSGRLQTRDEFLEWTLDRSNTYPGFRPQISSHSLAPLRTSNIEYPLRNHSSISFNTSSLPSLNSNQSSFSLPINHNQFPRPFSVQNSYIPFTPNSLVVPLINYPAPFFSPMLTPIITPILTPIIPSNFPPMLPIQGQNWSPFYPLLINPQLPNSNSNSLLQNTPTTLTQSVTLPSTNANNNFSKYYFELDWDLENPQGLFLFSLFPLPPFWTHNINQWILMTDIQYPISNIQYPIYNIQYPIFNIQYSISNMKLMNNNIVLIYQYIW